MKRLTRQVVEIEHDAWLWGQHHRITPRLVKGRFGNGRRIIGLAPLNTRPNYYIIRVDSRWDLSNWASGPLLIDHLEPILEAIEDQFGKAHCGDCDELYGDGGCESCQDAPASDGEFPALNWECGGEWFEIERDELFSSAKALAG